MKIVRKINGREVTDAEYQESVNPALLRDMLNSGKPPMSNTDREFLEGMHDNQQQQRLGMFAEDYRQKAVAAGVSPKGKVYMAGLAAYPGDPAAWVSGRADVKKVCEERNFGCDGAVSHKIDNSKPESLPEG